jgi:hypothetical protein
MPILWNPPVCALTLAYYLRHSAFVTHHVARILNPSLHHSPLLLCPLIVLLIAPADAMHAADPLTPIRHANSLLLLQPLFHFLSLPRLLPNLCYTPALRHRSLPCLFCYGPSVSSLLLFCYRRSCFCPFPLLLTLIALRLVNPTMLPPTIAVQIPVNVNPPTLLPSSVHEILHPFVA